MATWNPTAIYGAITTMSDADFLHWALTETARSMACHARMSRDPASIGNRGKPRLPEAAAYQAVSDRLAALASTAIAKGPSA